MRAWITPAIFLLACFSLQAQSPRLKKADQYFQEGNYQASIPLYHEVLQRQEVGHAKVNLAEAYYRIGDYHSAANWFALVMPLESCQPEHQLRYGLSLLRTGRCESATRWFGIYLEQRPFDSRKPELLDACTYYQQLRSGQAAEVEIQNLPINSPFNDFCPAFKKEQLVFTSDRFKGKGQRFARLYEAHQLAADSLAFGPPALLVVGNGKVYHEGPAVFNAEGNEVFFTRTRTGSEARSDHEISTGRLLPQGSWSAIHALPFCSDAYSVAFPALSPDGDRLFFASDMPGGYGGVDLYLSVRINGIWTTPTNLGPAINTPGDELFPYVGPDNTLYFASDGLVGLGMLDLFKTREGANGLWARPQNLGYPINSEADDFGFLLAPGGEEGYFSSNREGGSGGDDLYHFRRSGRIAVVDILDLNSGLPVPNGQLLNTSSGDTLQAGADGRVALRLPDCTSLVGWSDGFFPKSVDVCPEETPVDADTLFLAVALRPDLPQVVEGVVFDRSTGRPVTGVVIRLVPESPGQDILMASADFQGRFSLELQPRTCYRVVTDYEGYVPVRKGEAICASGGPSKQFLNLFLEPAVPYGSVKTEGSLAQPMLREHEDKFKDFERSPPNAEAPEGAVTYRLHVFYDVGRSSVQPGSVSELFKLRDLLLRYPELVVEIAAHTDANGDAEANRQLSQRRANAIVRYLVGEGIQRDRLIPVGYGESRLTNECADGVDCPDWKHQENRRTEFTVLKE